MKRYIKRFGRIIRIVGVVLLCVALLLTIYVTATIGGPWKAFSSAVRARGLDVNFRTRLRFDQAFFDALSRAASDKKQPDEIRAAAARASFASFDADDAKAVDAVNEKLISTVWAYFAEEFDVEAFLTLHATAENGLEARELKDIFAYLDGFASASAKGKAAKLKAASVEPWFQETYAAFAAERGETAGTYLEYMTVVSRMVQDWVAAGGTIKDVKSWYNTKFDADAYTEVLAAVRSEEKTEAVESVSARLASALESGESAEAALKAIWSDMKAADPELDESAFLVTMFELLKDESFDGSVKTVKEHMAAELEDRRAGSLSAFLDSWGPELVKAADNRSLVGAVSVFWWVTARFLYLWILGIVLVLAAFIMDRLLSAHMLKNNERAGIQEDPDVLLRVEHLCQYFRSGDSVNKAVDDVSFFVRKGEVFGLVGESGCGKTTTGRTIINLYDPTSGDVFFDGLRISSSRNGLPVLSFTLRQDARARITELREDMKKQISQHPEQRAELRRKCREQIRAVRRELSEKLIRAQDAALEGEVEKSRATQLYRQQKREQLTRRFEADARNLSGAALEERRHRYDVEMKAAATDNMMTRMQMIFQDPIASIDPRMTVREIISEGLRIRGIKDKKVIDQKVYEMLDLVGLVSEHADRYPHEFSGGQRQRIGIARAIALEPELIIADEPISALDVSIQAQVINLLNELRARMGLTLIFIAHNLSVVKYFSDRIAVMYYGNIVEMTASEELFEHPLHPYTRSLLSAIPYPDPHYEKQRKRLEYNPARAHDYSVDKPSLREIVPGHWIRCNDAEFAAYQKELGL